MSPEYATVGFMTSLCRRGRVCPRVTQGQGPAGVPHMTQGG